mmetsp:Transcript_20929/g.33532  ORF Transcript_20929/g.33532 Transcript_20929/m.33532 type:complete len:83 (+) Transcript_20929:1-249(+)
MGTGNDLSRSLGWGTMEPNHKNLVQYIADIHFCANITKRWSDLDRWRVTYTLPHLQDNNNNNSNVYDNNNSSSNNSNSRWRI